MFPVFLELEGRRVLVVGGGKVAAAKLGGLLEAGARVTVVAPEVGPELRREGVEVRERPFEPADLDGAWFVVAAAPAEVNRQVAAAAEERRIFVNAVDDPASGSAYTGGVFRRGGVTVAVSTEGASPALAGLLREGLEAVIPDDIERWVDKARALREQYRAQNVPMPNRRPLLLAALNELYERKRTDAAAPSPRSAP